ncbi:MarR family transcriptional regulator [Reyranella sp. MMS21-HV4-11]|jgi:DNA-binding MarR family transcriptional regulator|uniref:MarR family transcriptional regulator n=1 Tax=Reyranella humidisoli TaxID=2849149 RepID=A0ABS6IJI0_9HYPH|nr:MarR family transcriptional regulator [Reyranella sp. MMS21-HV4-11]MBU8873405.1 MarR family transcriptional regulator [Reyranella sp. MMS21-HV4-11]
MSKNSNATFQTTVHVYNHCLCFAAQRAARALARRFDEALSPIGLTSGQFSLLTSLNRPEAPSMGSIAALLVMDRTTLTANLKPLEQRGWVEIAVDPADRRVRRLILTAAGRRVLQSALPIWQDVHGEIDRLMPASDGRTLRRGLRALA